MTTNLWSAFSDTVQDHSSRDAIIAHQDQMTFSQWHSRAGAYAAQLRKLDFGKGNRVFIWMSPSTEMAAAMMGVWSLGGVAVLIDPSEKRPRFEHAVDTVQPSFILADLESDLPVESLEIPVLYSNEVRDIGTPYTSPNQVIATDPASIVFTSGSTGMPKAATQSHGSLVRACRAVSSYLGLKSNDRILCGLPWSGDYGYGQLLTTALIGTTHIIPERNDPFATCEAINDHAPTIFPSIPNGLIYLLRGLSPFRQTNLSSIRMITNTGASLPEAIVIELLDLMPHADVVLNYGLTESYRTTYLTPDLTSRFPTSIGRPIPGVDVALVGEDGKLVASDEDGEIVHRGDYLFMGYWGDAVATEIALRPDPLAPPGCPSPSRALYTGDIARRDQNGLLHFVGRRDQLLKSMGVRVSPGEVEQLLLRSPMITQAAVFGMPNDLIGDEVWAAVVPVTDANENEILGKIKEHAKQLMADSTVPRRYLVLNQIPQTRTGKNDYLQLKQAASQSPSASILER